MTINTKTKKRGALDLREKVFEIELDDLIIPLLAVGLAEMGDKTQLSILLLSSRTNEYARLLG